jgi:uncharacterized protein (DUF58 family)
MPTRQGMTIAVAALVAVLVGRIFGIVELFVIGAALGISVGVAVVVVQLHRPRIAVHRWIHPSVLTVGDTGRVDLSIENTGRWRSPRVELSEPVGASNTAHLTVGALAPGERVGAGYVVPAARRGVLTIGPTTIVRRDALGLASETTVVTAPTEVTVAPRTFDLAMPSLGHGVLGRHLLALAQRTGVGEFHSLRDYVTGDEPRTIHWRASARSEGLKVRQHEAQGVRRCIVVLDRDVASYPPPVDDASADVFERAITIAGSIALSADRAGLTTRFVSGGGVDLRGPEVAAHSLERLAEIELGPAIGDLERDPGEGLGLVVVITASPAAAAWRRPDRNVDPSLTRIGIFTAEDHGARGPLSVDGSSLTAFRDGWQRLAGQRGLTRELHAAGQLAGAPT